MFVTVDRNLSFQQNLTQSEIAVIVLRIRSNRFQDLLPLAPKIISALMTIERGKLVEIGA